MKNIYLKENFEKVVKSSFTIKEICIKLGLGKSGGSFYTVNKYINLYKIDISHFSHNGINNFILIPLSEILIENSLFSSTNHLKQRLYKEGIKERKCELCGQEEEWKGKHMSLILDHINGINDDNRIENLRIVCPNCNATLDTHCKGSKKRVVKDYLKTLDKEKLICKECGNNLKYVNKNNLCKKCSDIKQRKTERPSYKQLIEDIEKLGWNGTGRKYGVSDNSIRKWIKFEKNNIPL